MNTIKIDKYFKGMIANKGLSGIETENTVFSYLAAANRSYHGISCFLALSKDNKYILTESDTLLKYGLLNLNIPSFTYNELKKFSLLDRKTGNLNEFFYIPRLEDFLSICKAYQKAAFIRIKTNIKAEMLINLEGFLSDNSIKENYYFILEDKKQLQTLKKQFNNQSIFFHTDKVSEESLDFCKKQGVNLSCNYQRIKKEDIKELHLVGLKVLVGEVNDKEQAERMIKYDVDFILTSILE